MNTIEQQVANIKQLPEDTRSQNCGYTARDIRVLAGELRGFSKVAYVLSDARPSDQSVEDSGFILNFGQELLDTYDPKACEEGNYEKAVAQIAELKSKVNQELEQGLLLCFKIGWKSE